MSLPPLRQPKNMMSSPKLNRKCDNKPQQQQQAIQYVIITMKDGKKLVVPSDSYHGMYPIDDKVKCALCGVFVMDKNSHKNSPKHLEKIITCTHMDECAENLNRMINATECHCSICNVIISRHHMAIHLQNDVHKDELQKALTRSTVYKSA